MVEKLVRVCDFCDNKATTNCIICGKDCCSKHYKDKSICLGQEIICAVCLCKNCSRISFAQDFKDSLKKNVVEHLKKQGILNALDENKDDEEDSPIIQGYPLTSNAYKYGSGIINPWGKHKTI